MNDKVKIKVSEEAYNELLNIIREVEDHYSSIRLAYKDGCCGSIKVEIMLDNPKEDDKIDKVDEISFIYDDELIENIKEVIIVYRNNSFMIKTENVKELYKDCANCTKGCGTGHGKSGCGSCGGCGGGKK